MLAASHGVTRSYASPLRISKKIVGTLDVTPLQTNKLFLFKISIEVCMDYK